MLETLSKSVLFTAGVTCVVGGSNLIESNLNAAIILIVSGVALIFLYSILLERQTVRKACKLVLKHMRGLTLKERQRSG